MSTQMTSEMTPMDAWHVISAILADLYKKRKTNCFKGYVDADVQAEVICFQALKEMEEKNDGKHI